MSDGERWVQWMPLGEVRKAARNPKRHDGDGIRNSIVEHGFVELPTIDERTGRLVAGHGRLDQLLALWEGGAADPPDGIREGPNGTWQMPVMRGWRSKSDAHAEAYLLGSNELTRNGGWDRELLGEVLGDIDDDTLRALTGFDPDEIAVLIGDTAAPKKARKPTSRTVHTCPQCGHEWSDQDE